MKATIGIMLWLFSAVVVSAAPRDAEFAALKKAFPAHTAGPVTEKSDPLVIECYKRYKDVIDRMTLESLPADLSAMRKRLEYEIQHYEYELDRAKEVTGRDSSRQKVLTASMRHAMSMNNSWLKQKLRPYLARLESFQRGR